MRSDPSRNGTGVADVELDAERLGAQIGGGTLRPVLASAGHGYPGTGLYQRLGHSPPQATRAARHQDTGSAQLSHQG